MVSRGSGAQGQKWELALFFSSHCSDQPRLGLSFSSWMTVFRHLLGVCRSPRSLSGVGGESPEPSHPFSTSKKKKTQAMRDGQGYANFVAFYMFIVTLG